MWYSAVGFVVTLTLSLLVAPLAAEAQQATTVHRIGRLSSGSPSDPNLPLEAFRQGLRELGYVEGRNMLIESRYAEDQEDRFPALAAELVRLKVDVLVAGGATAIRAAQHATRTIPIVMAATNDPVAQGFIASLARPGGNITGLSDLGVELPGKRLEILKEAIPQSARIAVLVDPAAPYYAPWMHSLTVAAQALGLHLHVVEVRRAEELDTAFAAITQAGADALIAVSGPAPLNPLRRRIVDLAATHRLPAMYSWRELVEAGDLMAYGPSNLDISRRAATYVAKILKGAKPAELPVEPGYQVRVGHQPEDRQGPRDHDPPAPPRAGGRGDPVGGCRGTRVGQTRGILPPTQEDYITPCSKTLLEVCLTVSLEGISMATVPEIIPVTDLRQDAAAVLKRVQASHEPLVITQRGRAAAIMLSVEAYERGEQERQLLRLLVRGEQEIAAGTGYDLDEVLAEADTLLKDEVR